MAHMRPARLALKNQLRFAEADRYGGFVVGLIVVPAGIRVVRETAMQLVDTMPEARLIGQDGFQIAYMISGFLPGRPALWLWNGRGRSLIQQHAILTVESNKAHTSAKCGTHLRQNRIIRFANLE